MTVNDTQPPAVTCPANITVNAAPGQCASDVTFSVIATDNCAVTNVVSVPASGFAFPVGTTTVTSTARDASGNSSQCTFTVTVSDTQPPTLSALPSRNVNVQCLTDVPMAPTVTATDNCDTNVVVTYTPNESGDPCNRIINRIWSAVDSSSNTATFTQTIIVHDNSKPILTNGTIASSYFSVTEAEAAAIEATGASDNCGTLTKTAATAGECPAIITVTVSDACDNRDTATYETCISADISLTIVRNDGSVTVSWPFPSIQFVLESTLSLSTPNWLPVPEMPLINNDRLEVTVSIDQQERYFRLRRQ